mgnify:CR=1 FL=1
MVIVIIFRNTGWTECYFSPNYHAQVGCCSLCIDDTGGMILGPLVQKSSIWRILTGFPYGGDFTDNKMLIMWLAWALALAIIGSNPRKRKQ